MRNRRSPEFYNEQQVHGRSHGDEAGMQLIQEPWASGYAQPSPLLALNPLVLICLTALNFVDVLQSFLKVSVQQRKRMV
jgi:hypothetical protein